MFIKIGTREVETSRVLVTGPSGPVKDSVLATLAEDADGDFTVVDVLEDVIRDHRKVAALRDRDVIASITRTDDTTTSDVIKALGRDWTVIALAGTHAGAMALGALRVPMGVGASSAIVSHRGESWRAEL